MIPYEVLSYAQLKATPYFNGFSSRKVGSYNHYTGGHVYMVDDYNGEYYTIVHLDVPKSNEDPEFVLFHGHVEYDNKYAIVEVDKIKALIATAATVAGT